MERRYVFKLSHKEREHLLDALYFAHEKVKSTVFQTKGLKEKLLKDFSDLFVIIESKKPIKKRG